MRWLLWALVLLGSASLARADRLEEIRARGRLRVAVKNQGPDSPSLHKDPAHFQKRGFELAVAHAIARQILGDGNRIDFALMPKKTRLAAVIAGRVDLAISMFSADERHPQIAFSRPYYAAGLELLGRARGPQTLRALDGQTVAAVAEHVSDPGGELAHLLAARGLRVKIVRRASFDEAAAAVERGEAAALVSLNVNIAAFLATHPRGWRTFAGLLTHEHYAVAVPRGEPALLAQVNAAISGLEQTGDLTQLAAHWHLPPTAP